MGKIRKTTPEERDRQLANQRRLEELIERRLAEERKHPREKQPPAPKS
jgi:hypothetical protein